MNSDKPRKRPFDSLQRAAIKAPDKVRRLMEIEAARKGMLKAKPKKD